MTLISMKHETQPPEYSHKIARRPMGREKFGIRRILGYCLTSRRKVSVDYPRKGIVASTPFERVSGDCLPAPDFFFLRKFRHECTCPTRPSPIDFLAKANPVKVGGAPDLATFISVRGSRMPCFRTPFDFMRVSQDGRNVGSNGIFRRLVRSYHRVERVPLPVLSTKPFEFAGR